LGLEAGYDLYVNGMQLWNAPHTKFTVSYISTISQ